MQNTKYLIVGAGISGLTFANYCDGDYLIVEKENEPGGYCRTIRKGDFVWDYAGHFFHFKTEELKKRFIESLDESQYVFKEKKNGKTVRKEWPLSKLLEKVNSGELRLEFLCEYRDWHRRLIECWLWDEAHSWRACEIRFTAEPLYYCWNRIREDAAV